MKTFEELLKSRNIKECVEYWNDNELNKEDDALLKLKWKEGFMNIQTSKKPNGTLGIGWLE